MLAALNGYAFGALEQPAEVYKVGQHSVRFLMAFGDLVIGWLLARHARGRGPRPGRRGRIGGGPRLLRRQAGGGPVLHHQVLPRLESDRKVIEQATNDLMDVPESAF